MNKIKIGWGHRDITPQQPVALAGWVVDRYSEYVRDSLTVTALAIQSGEQDYTIMVSCDIINIESQLQSEVRQRMQNKFPDLDVSKLFLLATHTHNAPYLSEEHLQTFWGSTRSYQKDNDSDFLQPGEYHRILVDRISEAAIEAWQSRQEGGISSGYEYAVIGQNRRVVYDDGSVQMYGKTNNAIFRHFEGTADHSIEMLFLWDSRSELTGIAVNIACPSQTVESRRFVSSDYWHEVKTSLHEKFGKALYIFPMLAPAGDVTPHEMIRRPHRVQRDFDAEMKRTSRQIVFVFEELLPQAKQNIQMDVDIKHVVKDIMLPVRKITKKQAEDARDQYEAWSQELQIDPKEIYDDLNGKDRFKMADLLFTLQHYEKQQTNPFFQMELHVIKIGDIAITTNPFELYTDFGIRIKAQSKAKQTFNIQLACDKGGYLPTAQAVEGGGYGAWIFNGKVGPEGGDILVDHTVSIIHQLWK